MANTITQMIEQISKEKNIDSSVIVSALEDAMVAASRKYYKTTKTSMPGLIRRQGWSRSLR